MRRLPVRSALASAAVAVVAASFAIPGCLARPKGEIRRVTDDDAGPPGPTLIEGGALEDVKFDIPDTDPHAVLGVEPPHGPFAGGQLAIVRGNGFSSDVRVWFGDVEVPSAEVVPIDPGRVQVIVPPGSAGPVVVSTRNGDDESTRGELPGGYTYDEFYAEPSSGPLSGGTLVTLRGDGTSWDEQTTVEIDLNECEVQELVSPSELTCRTPPGTQGTKPIRVTTTDGVFVDVLDAFTYGDADEGLRGGLGGDPLAGRLDVIVLDSISGAPVPDAIVIAGDDLLDADVGSSDSGGRISFDVDGPTRSVTAAKNCYQPTTFVDVPVDTVTFFLDPVLSPACATNFGDLPPVGGSRGLSSTITGELVWDGGQEFQRGGWTNVPVPSSEDERQAAYLFALSSEPTREFRLPTTSSAVTIDAPGSIGFEFRTTASPGNRTLYALAGIENRELSPPVFTAYAMGLLKGVSAEPGKQTNDIFIKMDNPLDHAITLTVDGPAPTTKGPDRLRASVAVRVGNEGYAILPAGSRTELLPVSSELDFVGLPPLVGTLAGTEYVTAGSAVTGQAETFPKSVLGLLASTTSNQVVPLERFVEIPILDEPGNNGAWNGQDLEVDWAPGGETVSLSVYEIESGGGLISWVVAAPGGKKTVRLPDLAAFPGIGLASGGVSITVSVAHVRDFDYGSLRYRELGTRGWDSYAQDTYFAHF